MRPMNVLFLDDDPSRTAEFCSQVPSATCVSTAESCVAQLTDGCEWDYVFLDHDLGGEVFVDSSVDNSGGRVARWIAATRPNIGLIVLHSLSPAGAAYMRSVLLAADYDVRVMPFGWRQAGVFIKQEEYRRCDHD